MGTGHFLCWRGIPDFNFPKQNYRKTFCDFYNSSDDRLCCKHYIKAVNNECHSPLDCTRECGLVTCDCASPSCEPNIFLCSDDRLIMPPRHSHSRASGQAGRTTPYSTRGRGRSSRTSSQSTTPSSSTVSSLMLPSVSSVGDLSLNQFITLVGEAVSLQCQPQPPSGATPSLGTSQPLPSSTVVTVTASSAASETPWVPQFPLPSSPSPLPLSQGKVWWIAHTVNLCRQYLIIIVSYDRNLHVGVEILC